MENNMTNFIEVLQGAKRIGISGHLRPDGDCLGSCTALYTYLTENIEEIKNSKNDNIEIYVFLERIPENFMFLPNVDKIIVDYPDIEPLDVMICLDSSDLDRIGEARKYFEKAKKTICIDHHISNDNYADISHVLPDASSTCEVLYGVFDDSKISKKTATSLYTGLIHDTGVFKHSNTSKYTLEVAGNLIDKKVEFSKIIDESFYSKTFMQNQLLGMCLLNAKLELDNKVIVSYIDKVTMDNKGAKPSDLDGIIDQLRVTEGVEVAILLNETEPNVYKVSMRSNGDVNVSEIAVSFGGGGHVKAAGCSISGAVVEITSLLVDKISKQL